MVSQFYLASCDVVILKQLEAIILEATLFASCGVILTVLFLKVLKISSKYSPIPEDVVHT
jgi:hypothetical protein